MEKEPVVVVKKDNEVVVEVHEVVGEFESNGKWNWKLTFSSWYGREPKYDLRQWSEDMQKFGKGVTLTRDELFELHNIIDEIE